MKTRARNTKLKDSYLALIRRFPIRPIRTEADYQAATKVNRELALRSTVAALDEGEGDYLEALTRFIEDYESRRFLRHARRPTPLDTLKFFLDQHGMSAADLGRVLGSSSAASMILRGDREMSKTQIRKLADHFSVSAALFL